jgi:hypothetical protein
MGLAGERTAMEISVRVGGRRQRSGLVGQENVSGYYG